MVRSPRKLFIFIIYLKKIWIKVSKKYFFQLWKRKHWYSPRRLTCTSFPFPCTSSCCHCCDSKSIAGVELQEMTCLGCHTYIWVQAFASGFVGESIIDFVLASLSGRSSRILFILLLQNIMIGSKYPKNASCEFEDKIIWKHPTF